MTYMDFNKIKAHTTPSYLGQKKIGVCSRDGGRHHWTAKMHPDGDLRWFCHHSQAGKVVKG